MTLLQTAEVALLQLWSGNWGTSCLAPSTTTSITIRLTSGTHQFGMGSQTGTFVSRPSGPPFLVKNLAT